MDTATSRSRALLAVIVEPLAWFPVIAWEMTPHTQRQITAFSHLQAPTPYGQGCYLQEQYCKDEEVLR